MGARMERKNPIGALYGKHKEVLLYLVFGVLTTLVGWAVYFAVMYLGRSTFSVAIDDVRSGRYLAVYVAAQIVQWIAAVLFAFFTNRAFVFEGARNGCVPRQLAIFAGGRVASFILDLLVTYFGALLLSFLFPSFSAAVLFGRAWNLNEIGAKLVAAVIVIVSNYFFSKLLVFKKKNV